MNTSPDGKRVHGVLLDIDDTLVDTRGAFRHALGQIASLYLKSGADPEHVASFWRDDRNDWYRAHTRGEIDHREQRKRRANDLHSEFGGPVLDDSGYDIWNEEFEELFQANWRAHDDVVAFLDELEAAGVPYGAVSNAAFDYQVLKLRRCGLERVPMLVGVDTFGVGKPDPRVYREGARVLGIDIAGAAYIGDEYDIDAVGAAAAGLVGVWLDRPGARRSGVPDGAEHNPNIVHIRALAAVTSALELGASAN